MIGRPGATSSQARQGDWALNPDTERQIVLERLREVGRENEEVELEPLIEVLEDGERTYESKRDGLATRLMEIFRLHRSRAAFGLLYELNRHHLLQQVAGRLRRYQSKADPADVLQEVFVNI